MAPREGMLTAQPPAATAAAPANNGSSWDPERDGWDPEDPNRRCFTCGRPPTGRFDDGSPRFDHGHRPDGSVWEAEVDDDHDAVSTIRVRERPFPGIVRYAIVALKPGDTAPDELSTFIRQWRRSRPRRRVS